MNRFSKWRSVSLTAKEIVLELEKLNDPAAIEGMARFGITPERTYGVRVPRLRAIAKKTGRDHSLAVDLWKINTRETRILASMIAEPAKLEEAQAEAWVDQFDYWEICDQVCMNLLEKTSYAYKKAAEWSTRDEEYVKRAGFVLMARLAVSDKKAPNERFVPFLADIQRGSQDEREIVRKGVNWALRQMGKRNAVLNQKCRELARELSKSKSSKTRWVGRDALKELEGDRVLERLAEQERPKRTF